MQKPQEMLRKILALFGFQNLSEVNESSGKERGNPETGIGGDNDKNGSMLYPLYLLRATFATLSQVSVLGGGGCDIVSDHGSSLPPKPIHKDQAPHPSHSSPSNVFGFHRKGPFRQ